jgi:hypothetical protein
MDRCVHTLPKLDGGWINRCGRQILSEHEAKSRAVFAGRRFAQALYAEHAVHRRDGAESERCNFGRRLDEPVHRSLQ